MKADYLIVRIVGQEEQNFFDSSIFNTFITVSITIAIFLISNWLTDQKNKKNNKKEILNLLISNNLSFFSHIYKFSLEGVDIDYEKLRELLEEAGGVVYVLPEEVRQDFNTLYKIHFKSIPYYKSNKDEIKTILQKIVKKLSEYGVDAFE